MPSKTGLFILCLCLGAGLLGWRLGRSPLELESAPLAPGCAPSLILGRQGVEISGDRADPLVQAVILRDGRPAPEQELWTRAAEGWGLVFFDRGAGPAELQLRTRHRSLSQKLDPDAAPERLIQLWAQELAAPEGRRPEEERTLKLAFAPDGRRLACADFSGECRLLPLWGGEAAAAERKLESGAWSALAFSADSAVLLAGAESAESGVWGFAASSGKILWQLSVEKELGVGVPATHWSGRRGWPAVKRIVPLAGGEALVLAAREWRGEDGRLLRRGCLYRVAALTGEVRWRYAMPLSGVAADVAGRRLACLAQGEAGRLELRMLNGAGREEGRLEIEPLAPDFGRVEPTEACSVSPDGSAVALGLADGRVGLAEEKAGGNWAWRWLQAPGGPQEVGGGKVYAPVRKVEARAGEVLVWLGASARIGSGAEGESVGARAHSSACAVLALDGRTEEGRPLWRHDFPGLPAGMWLSPDGRWLAVGSWETAPADQTGQARPVESGLQILELRAGGVPRLICSHAVAGGLGDEAVFSPGGHWLAVLEGPRAAAEGASSRGRWRLVVLH